MHDTTKWVNWPVNEVTVMQTNKQMTKRKEKNYKKRQKKKSRKTRFLADKALESGSVVILVEEEVPSGAIAVLGKGLGFVPTPKPDILEERLQMRQTTNRILTASWKQTTD